jgi:hypothetical protein
VATKKLKPSKIPSFFKIFLLRNFTSKLGKTHRQEDLAKSGYKSDTTYKYLIALLYFWLHTENQINKSG